MIATKQTLEWTETERDTWQATCGGLRLIIDQRGEATFKVTAVALIDDATGWQVYNGDRVRSRRLAEEWCARIAASWAVFIQGAAAALASSNEG